MTRWTRIIVVNPNTVVVAIDAYVVILMDILAPTSTVVLSCCRRIRYIFSYITSFPIS